MSPQSRKLLVTSALPYVNGSPHMGHLVEYIQTDIWVRFQKLRGHTCTYVCASDAHGTPIMIKARELGVTPEELTTRVSEEFVRDFAAFGVDFDNYHSTFAEYAGLLGSNSGMRANDSMTLLYGSHGSDQIIDPFLV